MAPYTRPEKVFTEIRRPVFSLLDLRDLAGEKLLAHLAGSVLDELAEEVE